MLPIDHELRASRARTALEGLSIGDAFGERYFGPAGELALATGDRAPRPGPWYVTDDTVMAIGVHEVLLAHGRIDQGALARAFARRYALDPARGYGRMAHDLLRAMGRGEPWDVVSRAAFSGTGSMGNGAAMRVAPLGAYFADDLDALVENAARSAEVTHAHPEGQAGAIAVALAAAFACQKTEPGADAGAAMLAFVHSRTPDGPTRRGLARAAELAPTCSVRAAVEALGNGSRVIASDTVPFALFCAARHLDDYEEALWTTVSGLGDRDTTCAIVGGVVALRTGEASIPAPWRALREPLEAVDRKGARP